MPDANPVLEIDNLSAGYNGRAILREVSLAIEPGQNVALIGPNGCGKSTLFKVVAGLVRVGGGDVRLSGKSLARASTDLRIRAGIGYLMQTRNMFAGLSVAENLALAEESIGVVQKSKRLHKVLSAFPMLGDVKAKRAGLLSGGQRQALAVAMVLMRPVKVLLLDEPVAGLSPQAGAALLQSLKALQNDDGFSLIIIEHRLRQVQPYVDRVLVMREGQIVDDTQQAELMLDAAWLAGHYLNGKHEANDASR